nr:MAG TPA: hydrogenase small subunit [Caudoviricetes sp.]DAH29748.1 MAG TPA: hydrogenase small subunit [Caudoviricetes sp.]DAZ23787.1 MAG TPA: hydrogenase small subunit [Caudoviricetes sp.]
MYFHTSLDYIFIPIGCPPFRNNLLTIFLLLLRG